MSKGDIVVPTGDSSTSNINDDINIVDTPAPDLDEVVDEVVVPDETINEDIKIDDVVYKTDVDGNALAEDGTVFKTKDELGKLFDSDGKPIEVEDEVKTIELEDDGVVTTYKLDADGNALDDKGEIAYKAEDLKDFDEATNAVGIKEFIKEVNIPIYNDEGNEVEYDDTPQGRTQYVQDVYNRGGADSVNNVFKDLYGKHPVLQNVINHLELGGDIEDFKKQTDYSGIKLDKKDEAQLRRYAIEMYTDQGMTIDKANDYFDFIKSTGTDNDEIYKEGKTGLDYLKAKQETVNNRKAKDVADQEANSKIEMDNYWGVGINDKGALVNLNKEDSIYSVVNSGKLKVGDDTYNIPEKIKVIEDGKAKLYTKNDFFNYLYEPIVVNIDGERITTTRDNLKLQQENAKRTTGNDVFEAYRRFVGYDDSQLVSEKVKSKEVENVRRLVIKNKNKNVAANKKVAKKKIIINTNV